MAGRIYLANVGSNSSHPFASPIFADGRFEFLPIPEDKPIRGRQTVRYRNLRSFYHPSHDLLPYIPSRFWDHPTHNDPEFETFTYGDHCSVNPRAAALKQVEAGDFIFFISRLGNWREGRLTGEYGFYLVGFLEVDGILSEVTSRPKPSDLQRYISNAHVRYGLCFDGGWDRFWVFAGASRSERFYRAVPVTRKLVSSIFLTANEETWEWSDTRTDLQVIGSYTRSCRCIIDPKHTRGSARIGALWDFVKEYRASD